MVMMMIGKVGIIVVVVVMKRVEKVELSTT